MGRSLVRKALEHGDQVTAVGRVNESSPEQMSGWHENCLGSLCDVRVRETVNTTMQRTIAEWGRIDVIVK